jgi:hypothetical protein
MYTHANMEASGKSLLRVLLMGPKGSGKTCAAVGTAPGPVFVVNADPGGLHSVAKRGGKFTAEDINSFASWRSTVDMLVKSCKGQRPAYKTVVIDTLSLLSQILVEECRRGGLSSWDLYGELKNRIMGPFELLRTLPIHLIVCSHAVADLGEEKIGLIPMVEGKSGRLISAMLQDCLWLEVTHDLKTNAPVKREFLLQPHGSWKHGSKSIQHTDRIPADFRVYMREAGMKP